MLTIHFTERNELTILLLMVIVKKQTHGCYHHGHCGEYYDEGKWTKTIISRENEIKSLGYKVISITNCEWKNNPIRKSGIGLAPAIFLLLHRLY